MFQCLRLYSMQYILSITICIRDESWNTIESNLQRPMQHLYTGEATSAAINKQLKQVLFLMIEVTYQEVLDGLDEELKRKSRASWATCFCVLAILHMCAELVQIGTDLRLTSACDEGRELPTMDKSLKLAKEVEEWAVGVSTGLFHTVYKTGKYNSGSEKGCDFNPVRDEIEDKNIPIVGMSTVHLVESIRAIISNPGKYPHP